MWPKHGGSRVQALSPSFTRRRLKKVLGRPQSSTTRPYFSAPRRPADSPGRQKISGIYDGPITLRTALKRSKNMVSVRILNVIRPKYTQKFLTRFGFYASKQPAYLPMALGAGEVTPM